MFLSISMRKILSAFAALFVLNALLSMSNLWPTPFVYIDSRVAPEFVYTVCFLLVAYALKRSSLMSVRAIGWTSLAYTLLVLGRYFDTTAPALFGRAINLYWDGLQIPRLLWVLSGKYAWWVPPLVAAAVVVFLMGLFLLIRWALRVCAHTVVPFTMKSWFVKAVVLFLLLSSVANYLGVQQTWGYISRPVLPTYWAQSKVLVSALFEVGGKNVLPDSPKFTSNLGLLDGIDFNLFFLESYGAVTYDNADMKAALITGRAALDAQANLAGLTVLSAFVSSTTFGGGTDLAHMALLTGIDTRDPIRHDILLTTDRPTLIKHFKAQGFETFGFYPGLDWDWLEGSFFGYQHLVDARALQYKGPSIGYWKIPDQFAIAKFRALYPIKADTPPRMMLFASSSSHSPFHPVAPYQTDWQRVLSAKPFDESALAVIEKSTANWLDMTPGYTGLIAYNFQWLTGFLAQKHEREFALLALGDHQPTANITGEGASWDVPVHFFTNKPELIKRLQDVGFSVGLYPNRKAISSLPEFTTILLKALNRDK
jgi:hypothetical protein